MYIIVTLFYMNKTVKKKKLTGSRANLFVSYSLLGLNTVRNTVRKTERNLLGKAEECPGLPLVDADGGVGVQRWRCRLISHSLHHHPGKKLTSKK
jgi:hypothetical protein